MKRFFLLGIFCIILFSCKKNATKSKLPVISNSTVSNSFEIAGNLENFFPKKIFLNKIIEESMYQIDSCEVKNNYFTFKGQVEFPERFALTFENYSAVTILIIENSQIKLLINSKEISEPTITGSKANQLLNQYKKDSKQIFKKIEYLFPQFQKARLENDAVKLNEIGSQVKIIENEFTNFSYKFINQHKNSFVAAMILRDQLKSSNIDTVQIKKFYEILSSEVKQSPDAEIIASFLKLH